MMIDKKRGLQVAAFFLSLAVLSACSLEKLALKKAAGMLSSPSGSNVFTQDNDPEFVGAALPFAIKMYESLLNSLPGHDGLRLQTGSLYVMYANAYLQYPADMTPRTEFKNKEALLQRAKNLYLRGRDILLVALIRKNPRLMQQLKERRYKDATALYSKADVPFLYWAAAGWVGAFAIDPFDMTLGLTLPQASALMNRVLELDPHYSKGRIHDFYILYYGSLPPYMGGDLKKAREHFELSIAASGNTSASPFISLAVTVAVKGQNPEEFKSLLKQALAVDPEADINNRLINILNRKRALWLQDHIDDYFLLDEGQDNTDRAKQES